ncbi:MAG: hypothetical protein AUG49_03250 [Catenulispora sp. 13_1_20CM_3_70_7]|jgi:hypothetical protein|nr:MAG: hypothetical protein AUG49_03250 [Catenulispora sp. 13_1_20CM_3_70_7]
MDRRMSAPLRQSPDIPGRPGFRQLYPAPGLWPASNQLRVGAAAFIAVLLGIVLLFAVQPWSSGDDSTGYGSYPQGSAVHGGQPR